MEERRESCSRIKDGNLRLALGEVEVRSILKEYFENLYYMNNKQQVWLRCDLKRQLLRRRGD